MAKPITAWTDNSNKDTSVTFSDSSVSFNDTSIYFSGWDVTLPNPNKNKTAWNGSDKNKNNWYINYASFSTDTYNPTTVTYNTIYSKYDGNQSVTESPIQTKKFAVWSD